MDQQSETLGEKIRRARISNGFGLRELARQVDKAPSYLSDIEHDRRIPSEAVLRDVCKILSLDIDEMLSLAGRYGEETERYLKQNPAAGSLFRRVSKSRLNDAQLQELHNTLDELETTDEQSKKLP